MKIEILGTGCQKCQALAANAKAAAEMLGVEYELYKVTALSKIANRGVMVTPALAIDGSVKVAGRVTSATETAAILAIASSQ